MSSSMEDRLRDALRARADRTTTGVDAFGQIIRRAGAGGPGPAEVRGAGPRVAAIAIGLLLVLVVGALLAGNAPDDGGDVVAQAPVTSPRANATTTSSPGAPAAGDCPHRPSQSSPAVFDAAAGTYAAQALAFDRGAGTVSFDVVQWLTGDEARAAYFADNPQVDPGTPGEGPPNDYYLLDQNDLVRTAPIASDASVHLTHLATDGTAAVEADTLDALAAELANGHPEDTYWLSFADGAVVAVCQQYRP